MWALTHSDLHQRNMAQGRPMTGAAWWAMTGESVGPFAVKCGEKMFSQLGRMYVYIMLRTSNI